MQLSPTANEAAQSIDVCTSCRLPIGLAPPSLPEPASAWLCGGCGSAYFARRAHERTSLLQHSRPVHFGQVFSAANFNPTAAWRRAPLMELRRVLQFMSAFGGAGREKRTQRRHAVAIPALALPLGQDFRVIGAAMEMTLVNLSRAGGALIDAEPCRAPFLAIDFPIAKVHIQAVLKVLRVRAFMSVNETAGHWFCRIVPHAKND